MTSPDTEYASLAAFYRAAWDQLGRGVADAKHPARTPTLATIAANGFPVLRPRQKDLAALKKLPDT